MVANLKSHLENTTNISSNVIAEITAMYAQESWNLLDTISDITNTEVRDIVIGALREYHKALSTNNTTFPKVAQILSFQKTNTIPAANDEQDGDERLAA